MPPATRLTPLRSSTLRPAGRSLSRNAIPVPQPGAGSRTGLSDPSAAGLPDGSSGVSLASTSMLLALCDSGHHARLPTGGRG